MDESGLRNLLVFGAALLVLGLAVGAWLLTPALQETASPVLTDLFCQNANGSYVFGAPTSKEFCSAYRQHLKNVDSSVCAFYPEEKQGTCRDLTNLLEDRFLDCLVFRFTGNTDYPDGAPQIREFCQELTS